MVHVRLFPFPLARWKKRANGMEPQKLIGQSLAAKNGGFTLFNFS
jgi:hypothetical protein